MIDISLTQIDPATNRVVAQYIGTGGDALRIGHGAAWMCSFFLQELWRVPLPLIKADKAGIIRVSAGAAGVLNAPQSRLVRSEPKPR
jgi:hypothetical protein